MAGRPRKVVEGIEVSTHTNEIKHVVRTLALSTNGTGAESPAAVEAYMKETYFDKGWSLFDVSPLSHDPNTIAFMYILTR